MTHSQIGLCFFQRCRTWISLSTLVGSLFLAALASAPQVPPAYMWQAKSSKGAAVVSIAELRSQSLPKDTRILLKQAIKLDERGKTASALGLLERALHEAPDFIQVHVAQAIGYVKLQELGPARKHVSAALALDPDNIPAREVLAAIEIAGGNLAQAKELLESIVRVAPRRPMVHSYLSIVFKAEGLTAQAEECARRSDQLRRHPPQPIETDSYIGYFFDRSLSFP